jgi:hypothetical protein
MTNFLKIISIIFCSFLYITESNAQAPNLGTAASFELFTTVGAVGNTGISQITGNVGTNSGGITGFGNVNGVMHNNDGATLTAANDLLSAYQQLDTTTANFFIAPLLGNGDTLAPGVYSISGNTTANLILNLNAGGNPNAVFIFQIAGTFSLNALAQINLINGAMACNVFWKVEGLVSLAPNATMRGTIIANNAAININSGVTLEGRALSTAGAISVNGVLAYTPVGCSSPVLTGPAAPTLASTACYALFSGNGSNINSGVSFVTGDVGTNVGLTTGYDALTVNGMIHPIPDGSTAACAADLLNVYNYLNTLPADIELLYPDQFGNSLVLTPHTYLMNAATALTDTLYLNAQGDSDAVFVIKINGALSTSTFAAVTLINGTKAANVYWKVDGAVGINDFTLFKGTLICNNGSVTLNTGVTIDGRALTTNGAFSTASVNVSTGLTPCSIPLPMGWIYFRGNAFGNNAKLEWATTNLMNSSYFILEKSQDGVTFKTIATIKASAVTTAAELDYTYTDYNISGNSYYRISSMNPNGAISYFKTIQVASEATAANETAVFYPNPWSSVLFLNIQDATPTNSKQLIIYNVLGTAVINRTITAPITSIDAAMLPAGVYYYKIIAANGTVQQGKLMANSK